MAFLLKWLGSFLTFGILIPVWVILLVAGWFHFDKSSAIRLAVDKAVTELVAGAELEAERSRSTALQKIATERQQKLEREQAANRKFIDELATASRQLDDANEQIEKILSRPNRIVCDLDDDLFNGLRSK